MLLIRRRMSLEQMALSMMTADERRTQAREGWGWKRKHRPKPKLPRHPVPFLRTIRVVAPCCSHKIECVNLHTGKDFSLFPQAEDRMATVYADLHFQDSWFDYETAGEVVLYKGQCPKCGEVLSRRERFSRQEMSSEQDLRDATMQREDERRRKFEFDRRRMQDLCERVAKDADRKAMAAFGAGRQLSEDEAAAFNRARQQGFDLSMNYATSRFSRLMRGLNPDPLQTLSGLDAGWGAHPQTLANLRSMGLKGGQFINGVYHSKDRRTI